MKQTRVEPGRCNGAAHFVSLELPKLLCDAALPGVCSEQMDVELITRDAMIAAAAAAAAAGQGNELQL